MCRIGVVEYFLSNFTFSEDNFLLVSERNTKETP